jgi:hypothetical protein
MQQKRFQRRTSTRSRSKDSASSHWNRLPLNLRAKVLETSTMIKEYDTETGSKIINDYLILEEIGRGTFGKVKLAQDLRTNELVVRKLDETRFSVDLSGCFDDHFSRLSKSLKDIQGGSTWK